METPKEYYYTYYSYEEWGRGYFGSRGCKCLPEKDVKYFGSFYDKTFRPTQKIILKSDYATREEAYADEIILHNYYDVANNPHFANRAKQTTTSFSVSQERMKEVNDKLYKEKKGFHSLSKERKSELGRKNAKYNVENCIGIHGRTKEQRTEDCRKGGKTMGKRCKENKLGIFGLTKEQRIENGKKTAQIQQKNKTGFYGFTTEDRREYVKITNSQRWECCETGYVSTAAGVVSYQKARGIDTSKSNRRRIA